MIEIQQRNQVINHKPEMVTFPPLEENGTLLKPVVMVWLLVSIVLLPVLRFELPLGMAVIDVWIMLGLPVAWLYLIQGRHPVRLPYITGWWLIILGTFISTYAAINLGYSLTVLLKEIYLYVWFVTLVAVLSTLKANQWRQVKLVWLGMILFHGGILLAQFFFPEFLKATSANLGNYDTRGAFRPIGLTENDNMAASYQLTGFVPLLLLRPSVRIGFILGVLITVMTMATFSMGATVSIIGSLLLLFILSSFLIGDGLRTIIKFFLLVTVVLLLLAGGLSFYLSQSPDQMERFNNLTVGRSEKSAEGRYELWGTAVNLILSGEKIWGVGANNFIYYGHNGMHNDLLAFFAERGLIGGLGLVIMVVSAGQKPIVLLLKYNEYPHLTWPALVFVSGLALMLFNSLTHQVFHFRFFWLILAVQEALIECKLTSETKP